VADVSSVLPRLTACKQPCVAVEFLELLGIKPKDEYFQSRILSPTYQAFVYAQTHPIRVEIPDPALVRFGYDPYENPRDWSNGFISVIKQTKLLGLKTELGPLLQFGLPRLPSSGSNLWSNRRFLTEFGFKLANVLLNENNEQILAIAREFIVSTVCGAAKYLWQRRPVAPRDWTRTTNHTCDAPSCREVRRFLTNPKQASAQFSYPQRDRKHMENSLPCEDYKFETIKTKSPHTLVIHKTTNEYDRGQNRWEAEVRSLQDSVHLRCDNTSFQHLLGAELEPLSTKFKQLLMGEGGNDTTHLQGQAAQPFQLTSASAQNSRTAASGDGQSAEEEIIDLTGDACG
jgi:hypothetical protein